VMRSISSSPSTRLKTSPPSGAICCRGRVGEEHQGGCHGFSGEEQRGGERRRRGVLSLASVSSIISRVRPPLCLLDRRGVGVD
jgi:hypothetical protein